jgi:cyclopropane-fatty-acyl-phospholipid synthase
MPQEAIGRDDSAALSSAPARRSSVDRVAFAVARRLHRALGASDVRFELCDGRAIGPERKQAAATLRFLDSRGPLALALDADFALGELYAKGRIAVDGSLIEFLSRTDEASSRGGLAGALHRALRTGAPAAWRQALGRAAGNARHHYDVGNAFYSLWLDERMVYTCAYFAQPELTLEQAQLAKLDHVCRKLRLRPGQRVLELGCGWGALAIHMATHYGAQVRAFNVSREQLSWAREQAQKQGVASRVEFVLDDYRNADGRYDALASVGMLEHVGPGHYEELGRVIDRTLAPDGLGFIHTIGRSQPQPLNRWVATRIFPHAHPPALSEMMRIFEPHRFAVLDVENLRLHYERTARHWLARFQRSWPEIVTRVPEETARAFEFYLAGTVAAFRCAWMCLYQVVFARAKNDAVPWTRADVYGAADGAR